MIENNKRVREEIWKSVAGLSNEKLNESVEIGSWSIAQVLEHLYLIEEAVVQDIHISIEKKEKRTAKEKPIHLAADHTMKVEAPSYLNPTKNFRTLDELKERLDGSREALIGILKDFDLETLKQYSFRHPYFGFLDIKQWVSFLAFHEQRHLKQIEEIKMRLK